MKTNPLRKTLLFSILIASLAVSTYLLLHHFALVDGERAGSSFCSILFRQSCDAALMSRYSLLWGIPLGGWGMAYASVLMVCLLLSHWMPDEYQDNLLQTAFWITAGGSGFSAFYLLRMIANPMLVCPMCLVFHGFNFTLLFLLKSTTRLSWPELAKGLWSAVLFVITGRQPAMAPFASWKWMGYLILVLTGLVVYQRVRMEMLSKKINQLVSYDPLKVLEAFDSLTVYQVPIHPDDPVLGPPGAPISMVVYSDFQCSVCKIFASNFADLVRYNQGKLHIRFKHFPLSKQCNPKAAEDIHPSACTAAWAAEAARRQGKFWTLHDALFKNDLEHTSSDILLDSVLQMPGLDPNRFQNDFSSDSCRNKVSQDIQEALHLGVNSTPTVFLNGRKINDLRSNNLNFFIRYLLRPQEAEQ